MGCVGNRILDTHHFQTSQKTRVSWDAMGYFHDIFIIIKKGLIQRTMDASVSENAVRRDKQHTANVTYPADVTYAQLIDDKLYYYYYYHYCIYVCAYIYIYIYTHIHSYIYIYIYVYIYYYNILYYIILYIILYYIIVYYIIYQIIYHII